MALYGLRLGMICISFTVESHNLHIWLRQIQLGLKKREQECESYVIWAIPPTYCLWERSSSERWEYVLIGVTVKFQGGSTEDAL